MPYKLTIEPHTTRHGVTMWESTYIDPISHTIHSRWWDERDITAILDWVEDIQKGGMTKFA